MNRCSIYKILFLYCLGAGLWGLPFWASAQATQLMTGDQTDLVIRIGHAAPLSGPIGHLGREHEAGARAAIADLNSRRLRIGGRSARFELISLDDEANPSQAVEVALRFVNEEVVGVIGHLTSGASLPAAAIYRGAGIPQISSSSVNPALTEVGAGIAFLVVPNDLQMSEALAEYFVKKLNIQKVAIVGDGSPYAEALTSSFSRSFERLGGLINYRTEDITDELSMKSKIESILGARVDLVFYAGMDREAASVLSRLRSAGYRGRFAGGEGICAMDFAQRAGEMSGAGGIICAEPGGIERDRRAALDRFLAHHADQLGQMGVLYYAPFTYDAVMVMAEAMVRANSSLPSVYLRELFKTDHNGLMGRIQFAPSGKLRAGSITILTYSRGIRMLMDVYRTQFQN